MSYRQHVDTKQCPLCRREMVAIETHMGRGELYCAHCDLTIGGNDPKTPGELQALLRQAKEPPLTVGKILEVVSPEEDVYIQSPKKCWHVVNAKDVKAYVSIKEVKSVRVGEAYELVLDVRE